MAGPPSASDLTQLSWLVDMNPRFASIEAPARCGAALDETVATSRGSRALRKKRSAADRPLPANHSKPAAPGRPSKRSLLSAVPTLSCGDLHEARRSHQRLHAMAQCAIEQEDAATEPEDHRVYSMRALVAFALCAGLEATGLGPSMLLANGTAHAPGGRTANHVARWIQRHFPETADSTE
jgi:hypothetical protein